jgi:hypothetical protein
MQKRNPEHPAFLTDGAGSDIDPADSEQLLLPSLLSGFFFYYSFTAYNLMTYRNIVFAVSVCQQAEVTYPHITGR